MDTNLIKPAGMILFGGLLGGISGYFLGNLIVDELYQRQFEMDEAERFVEDVEIHPSDESSEVEQKKAAKDYTKFSKGELADLVKPYTTSIEKDILVKKSDKNEPKSDRIMIIDFDDYASDRSHNKEPITYYENDTTFANAQEDIIDNPVSIFGPNIHLHFGEANDDPDIVYVRNENNGVDYEISRVHNSYSVVVMGMPEELPKETKAKRRKTVKKVNAHDDEDEEDAED